MCSKMKLLPVLCLTQYFSVSLVPAEIIGDQLLCEPYFQKTFLYATEFSYLDVEGTRH